MQRQSLGSPTSKIHRSAVGAEWDEEMKEEKRARCGLRADRSIHLVPVITLLCFLVLYLISYRPSPEDLEAIGGGGGALRLLRDPKAISEGAARESAARGDRGLKAALVAAGGKRRRGGSLPTRKLGAAVRRAVLV